jgi:hypothetical protein
MIYLLTAIGLTTGGSSTVHIYTQTVRRTTQLTALVVRLSGIRTQSGQSNWEVLAVPRLCELYAGICLITEEEARKNLSQGSRRVPVGDSSFGPCWYQSVPCVITHPVTAVSGSPPSLYLSPPRFCFSDVNRLQSLDGESPDSVSISVDPLVTGLLTVCTDLADPLACYQ